MLKFVHLLTLFFLTGCISQLQVDPKQYSTSKLLPKDLAIKHLMATESRFISQCRYTEDGLSAQSIHPWIGWELGNYEDYSMVGLSEYQGKSIIAIQYGEGVFTSRKCVHYYNTDSERDKAVIAMLSMGVKLHGYSKP